MHQLMADLQQQEDAAVKAAERARAMEAGPDVLLPLQGAAAQLARARQRLQKRLVRTSQRR